jgi:hypothetical protein
VAVAIGDVVLVAARHEIPDGIRQLVFGLNETVVSFLVIVIGDMKGRGGR